MKQIFKSDNIALVSFYKTLLEDNGIECIVKNYYLSSGVGDLPPQAILPELWILDDEQYGVATSLLTVEKGESWRSQCGELIGGQFAQCWKCGEVRK